MKKIKWLISELVKILSSQDSFFSKKRIESFVAFIIGQVGMVFFLFNKYENISMYEFLMWAAVEFTIAGYIMNVIEKGKSFDTTQKVENNDGDGTKTVETTTSVSGNSSSFVGDDPTSVSGNSSSFVGGDPTEVIK